MQEVKLMDPADVLAAVPALEIVEDITVSGYVSLEDRCYRKPSYNLPKLRLAGHLIDDKFHPVSILRSPGYHETSHLETLEAVFNNLTQRGLDFGVWKNTYSRDYGVQRTDILFKKQYHIAEDCFDKNIRYPVGEHEFYTADDFTVAELRRENIIAVKVLEENAQICKRCGGGPETTLCRNKPQSPDAEGVYQPMLRLVNSFYGSSQLEFALVRILCHNGLFRIAEKLKILFTHANKKVIDDFEKSSDRFLNNIFTGELIESTIEMLSHRSVPLEKFLGWIIREAGPKAAVALVEQFNLEDEAYLDNAPVKVNAWIAYNYMTWLTSHVIKAHDKQQRLFAGFQNSLKKAA